VLFVAEIVIDTGQVNTRLIANVTDSDCLIARLGKHWSGSDENFLACVFFGHFSYLGFKFEQRNSLRPFTLRRWPLSPEGNCFAANKPTNRD
jgi:hypothetical protein